jgi:hypothetical protein
MAVLSDPSIAANTMRVGMGTGMVWTPAHTVAGPLPVGNGGAFRVSATSGTMAAALAGASEIFQFRYVTAASRVCLVHGISISAGANVAAGAAALVAFKATVARGWTVAGTGGTRLTLTGDNQALRTSHATSEVSDAGIATTAALTAGTKTLDAQDIGAVSFGIGTGALTTTPYFSICPKTVLFGDFIGGLSWPLVLVNQEGFVIRTGVNAFPTTMTWSFSVDVAWSEVDAF